MSERGNVTVMTLGFLAVLGLLVTVVVNASAAYLERRELMSLADQIALHAADGLDRDEVYTTGVRDEATLDAADARAAEEVRHGQYRGLEDPARRAAEAR